jgi:chromosome segregation ATPase
MAIKGRSSSPTPEEPLAETAADDDGIVDTTDEVALLQSENNDLREEVAELKRSLEDAEQRAQGIDPNRLQEGEEDKYEVCEEDDGWVGEGVHRRKRLTWDAFCEKHERAVRTVKMRLDGEAALLKDIRRLKDSLVEKCTQLRAALAQVDLDNRTIKQLRNELHAKDKNLKLMESKESQTKKLLGTLSKEYKDFKQELWERDENTREMIAELNYLRDKEAKRQERRRQRIESVRFGEEPASVSPVRPSPSGDTPFMEWKASLAGQLQPLKRDFDPHPPGSREAARAKRLWSTPTPGGFMRF